MFVCKLSVALLVIILCLHKYFLAFKKKERNFILKGCGAHIFFCLDIGILLYPRSLNERLLIETFTSLKKKTKTKVENERKTEKHTK